MMASSSSKKVDEMELRHDLPFRLSVLWAAIVELELAFTPGTLIVNMELSTA